MREVTDYLEFTGTTVASERVDVRARVSGILKSIEFTPGTNVEKDEVLFVIDPLEYEAALQAAQADRAAAEAQTKRAETEYGRAKRLFEQQAGSESDMVKWLGELEVAAAGSMPKMKGIRMARAVSPPIPGRTPKISPMGTATTMSPRTLGWRN